MFYIRRCIVAIVLSVAGLWVYTPLRTAGFVYEDLRWRLLATTRPATILRPRSLMLWLWWVQARLTSSAFSFHLLSLGLHIMVAVLLALLVQRLGASRIAAWIAGVVWLVHPAGVETAVYLSARPELYAAIGVLSACLIATGEWWQILKLAGLASVIAFGLAGKETAIVALGLVPLITVTSGSWHGAPMFRRWIFLSGWLLGVGVVGWYAWQAGIWNLGEEPGVRVAWSDWVLLQGTALYRSIFAAIWPWAAHTVDYDYDIIAPWVRVVSVGFLVLLCIMMGIVCRRHPLALCGLAWLLIAVAPRFVIQTPRSYLNDHQLYVPMMGIAMMFAAGVDALAVDRCARALGADSRQVHL